MRALVTSFRDRPTARAVALFGALNFAMALAFMLAVPARYERPATPPLLVPERAAIRVALVLAGYAVVVWAVRPGRRTRLELAALVAVGIAATAFASRVYFPFLPLAVLPVAARYWLSLRATLAVTLVAFLASVPLWLPAVAGHRPLIMALLALAVTVALNGYTLLSFEFALREARAREGLRALQALTVRHAELAERARVARELHDTLGHHLTAQRFDLQLLAALGGASEAQPPLERATARNADALAEVRRAVRAQPPEPLEGGLTGALHALARGWPTPVHLTVQGEEPRLTDDTRLVVYRAAQEALTNAGRHAPGAVPRVTLTFLPGEVRLEAENAQAPHRVTLGGGLRGLEARAHALNGGVSVSTAGGVFTLRLAVPLTVAAP
ncbi:sensor histidine kinase [Deinococcus sonorensis]|uniref:histidine kinase n=2 Tax=Deinococcus sonorensis TaxID=309891 RepID=A0AAU7U681_9DEIO